MKRYLFRYLVAVCVGGLLGLEISRQFLDGRALDGVLLLCAFVLLEFYLYLRGKEEIE